MNDLVREGKWTLTELLKYTAAAANLNGDESFAFEPDGTMHTNNATGDDPAGYLNVFRAGRSLFLTAGLSAISE